MHVGMVPVNEKQNYQRIHFLKTNQSFMIYKIKSMNM